jgi:hypothetical protein
VNHYIHSLTQQFNRILLPFVWDDQVDHRSSTYSRTIANSK